MDNKPRAAVGLCFLPRPSLHRSKYSRAAGLSGHTLKLVAMIPEGPVAAR